MVPGTPLRTPRDVLCGFSAPPVALTLSATPDGLLELGAPDTLNPGKTVDPTAGGNPAPVALPVLAAPTLIPNELPPYHTTVLPSVSVVALGCHG